MKICVTAKGPGPEDLLEERFGRTPYFLIHDTEAGTWTAVQNPHAGAMGGVGPRSAQVLVDQGASVLITGNVGGNALNALKAANIEIYFVRESLKAKDAFQAFADGKLTRAA
jgi:predicted Fe-Mo cluster-binding NifX family protein